MRRTSAGDNFLMFSVSSNRHSVFYCQRSYLLDSYPQGITVVPNLQYFTSSDV